MGREAWSVERYLPPFTFTDYWLLTTILAPLATILSPHATRHTPLRLRWVPEASAGRSPRHHTHPTSPHLASVIRHLPSVIRHLPSVIRHLPSVIRHPAFAIFLFFFPIPHSEFRIPHFPKGFQRSQQLSLPGGLVAAVPLECRAAIERRAVVPLVGLVGLDFLMLGQQLLEPADVPLDDRSERGHPLSGTKEMWLAPFDSLQIH